MSWYASRVKKKSLIDALRRTIVHLEKDASIHVSESTIKKLKQALVRRVAEYGTPEDLPNAIVIARSHE